MLLAMRIGVVCSKYRVCQVLANLRARLMLSDCDCSCSEHIPVEGLNSGTCCGVACIEMIRLLMCKLAEDLVLGLVGGWQR